MISAELMPNGRLGARPLLPWVANPHRLVSLLEMLEFHAVEFVRLSSSTAALDLLFREGGYAAEGLINLKLIDDPSYDDSEKEVVSVARRTVSKWESHVTKYQALGLDSAAAQMERIHAAVKRGCTIKELGGMLQELRRRIEDQLGNRIFLFVPTEKARFYSEKSLFGTDIEAKLPGTIYDIEEAGKCLALSRSTATVCHLMRVVEVGVHSLASKLSTTINTDQTWGAILKQVDDEIRAMSRAGTNVDELNGISASLHAVKDAWRNPAMHSKSKYTEDEAEEIFNACRTFMKRLAQIV